MTSASPYRLGESASDDGRIGERHGVERMPGAKSNATPLDETLKIELPSRPTVPSLVTLRHFRDIPEALLAKGMLESAGIRCVLADGNLVRMDWLLSNAIGGIRLQVDKQELEAARALLDEPIPAELPDDEFGEPYSQPRCPRCYSLDIGF